VSYYSAGGYYQAGGFWKKLVKGATKLGSFISKTPILSGVVGMIPGASTVLSGLSIIDGIGGRKTVPAALAASTAGTPGHNAAVMAGRPMRRLRRRRARRW
jgi:hypothetical protein